MYGYCDRKPLICLATIFFKALLFCRAVWDLCWPHREKTNSTRPCSLKKAAFLAEIFCLRLIECSRIWTQNRNNSGCIPENISSHRQFSSFKLYYVAVHENHYKRCFIFFIQHIRNFIMVFRLEARISPVFSSLEPGEISLTWNQSRRYTLYGPIHWSLAEHLFHFISIPFPVIACSEWVSAIH